MKYLKCLAILVSLLSAASVDAASEKLELDKRVTDSTIYQQLDPSSQREQGITPPTDQTQQLRGCATAMSMTPGSYNARRAQNLAATNHFAEAIGEWTRAIDSYDDDKAHHFGVSLDPEWLLSRARLYIKLGRQEDALADIERSATMPRSFDQVKFNAALLFAELGKYARAESAVSTSSPGFQSFRPYYSYLTAVLQQKQDKMEMAKQKFKEAATLFAAAGMTPPAQSCLDAITAIEGKNGKPATSLNIANLEPPRSNYDNIERLFKALAKRSDVFDLDVLKGLTGAASFKETRIGYLVHPYLAHFKEISLITVDKLESGGKRLNIHMQPVLCSINKLALKGLLNHPVKVSEKWRKEVAYSEGYKVPSGTLVLSILNGGFNSIWQVQLYSKDATFPEPQRNQTAIIDNALQQSHIRLVDANEALQMGNIDYAKKVAAEWLHDTPENPRAHVLQAEIFFKQGKLAQAMESIDTAIKYSDHDGLLKDKYTGNVLLIKKGTYLLEQGDFDNAYSLFKQAFPEKPSADQLLLRARAEIGIKNLSGASNDLKEASKKFYEEGRIIRRDETERLLNSINGNPSYQKQQTTQALTTRSITADALKIESTKAAMIVGQLQEEKQQRERAKVKHDQDLIAKATNRLIIATPQKPINKNEYILALLALSQSASDLGQRATAQNYIDKAISCYQTYTPKTNYDACTRLLINQLTVFAGSQFQDRVERVARHSELFCNNQSFQRERDSAFIELLRNPEAAIAMTEKLVAIREELQPKTGNSLKPLCLRLPKSYKGKGQYKELNAFITMPRHYQLETPNSAVASLFDASTQALSKTEDVLNAISAKDFSKSEILINQLEQTYSKPPAPDSFSKLILYSQYSAIADGYLEQSATKLADKSLRKAISTFGAAKPADLAPILKLLSKLRTVYEDSEQFQLAASLYEYALDKLAKRIIEDSKEFSEIKMSLAEILLNRERHLADKQLGAKLKAKAARLFDESSHNPANRHLAGSSKADIQLRRTLAAKYPALVKLDLPNGTVVYEEPGQRPGSRMGATVDGREIQIIGPSSIGVIGIGEGRQRILLDGQTLTEKAQIQLRNGNLPLAENLLVSALRADPNSENFSLLAKCWYLQRKFESALQAASMALDADSTNKQATEIQQKCQKLLKKSPKH